MQGGKHRFLSFSLGLALAFMPMLSSARAAESLHGYEKEAGYCYVQLGQYPQRVLTGNAKVDGGASEEKAWTWSNHQLKADDAYETITDPILWRVLSVEEDTAYLCSEYVLFAHPLHVDYTAYKQLGKDFGQTDLCAYLNTTFASQAFTEAERTMLQDTKTFGKVFLLDAADVKNKAYGLGNGKPLKAWATEYAIRVTHAFVYGVASGCHSPYWVRNQSSTDARHGRCTKTDGSLGHIIADRDNEGVRPAVYLLADSYTIAGGAGTREDPYRLMPKEE